MPLRGISTYSRPCFSANNRAICPWLQNDSRSSALANPSLGCVRYIAIAVSSCPAVSFFSSNRRVPSQNGSCTAFFADSFGAAGIVRIVTGRACPLTPVGDPTAVVSVSRVSGPGPLAFSGFGVSTGFGAPFGDATGRVTTSCGRRFTSENGLIGLDGVILWDDVRRHCYQELRARVVCRVGFRQVAQERDVPQERQAVRLPRAQGLHQPANHRRFAVLQPYD